METKKENSQPALPAQNSPPAGMPDWVMHLLTGLGTMGAEYMMFIKPMQDKMEQQNKVIKEQNERIEELEDLLQGRRKVKRSTHEDDEDDDEEEDRELFQVKRKPIATPKYSKHARIKF